MAEKTTADITPEIAARLKEIENMTEEEREALFARSRNQRPANRNPTVRINMDALKQYANTSRRAASSTEKND